MSSLIKHLLEKKTSRKVIYCPPDTMVIDALKTMKEYNIGAMLVMEGDHLSGIFSERDYARKGIVEGRIATSTPIKEVMTPKVLTVNSKQTLVDCMEIMSAKKFRHLPVVDDEKVVGILSIGDIVTEMLHEQKEHIRYLEGYISGQ